MYHVKEYPYPVPGNLDLNIADEEEFSPDKLRANLERLYMTIIISIMGSGKQVARLRSWRETTRTTAFCVVCSNPVPEFRAALNEDLRCIFSHGLSICLSQYLLQLLLYLLYILHLGSCCFLLHL